MLQAAALQAGFGVVFAIVFAVTASWRQISILTGLPGLAIMLLTSAVTFRQALRLDKQD